MDFLPSLLVPLAIAAAIGVWWYQHRRAAERREALIVLAAARGLDYARRDHLGTLGLGFALFRRGDDQGVHNVVHGQADGRAVRVFDLWIMTETTDGKGHRSRSYRHYSCALGTADGMHWPHLRIGPESLFTRAKDAVGFRDIEFESEEFNRAFEVRCDDRRFAHAFVDPRMMAWLQSTDGRYSFEVRGSHLLVATDRVPADEFLILDDVVGLFEARIPAVVRSLYPGA